MTATESMPVVVATKKDVKKKKATRVGRMLETVQSIGQTLQPKQPMPVVRMVEPMRLMKVKAVKPRPVMPVTATESMPVVVATKKDVRKKEMATW